MILISNIVLEVLEGSTIASTEIYGTGKKVYINIGSGNVFNLKWDTPTLTADTVDYYNLVIKRYDPTLNVYYDIFDKNIGLVNEFYVDSPLVPALPEQYMLHIYIVARGKNGGVATSNVVTPYVFKGSGTYVKVQPEGYAQPIIKRAIAFVNTKQVTADGALAEQSSQFLTDSNGKILTSNEGYILTVRGFETATIKNFDGEEVPILDTDKNEVQLAVTKLLTSNTWQLVQSSYVKDPDNTWQTTDIKYEVLVDENGLIITDDTDEPIYIL